MLVNLRPLGEAAPYGVRGGQPPKARHIGSGSPCRSVEGHLGAEGGAGRGAPRTAAP